MNSENEFWDWKAEAPVKIDCSDHDYHGNALTYDPHGCIGCSNEIQYQDTCHGSYKYKCVKGHNMVYFNLYRNRPSCEKGRLQYTVRYRIYEPDDRPEPIPAERIAEVLDGMVMEGKELLPLKEEIYGNLFPGGAPEIARRLVEKTTRLLGGADKCEAYADTEVDIINYAAIHRSLRYRDQVDTPILNAIKEAIADIDASSTESDEQQKMRGIAIECVKGVILDTKKNCSYKFTDGGTIMDDGVYIEIEMIFDKGVKNSIFGKKFFKRMDEESNLEVRYITVDWTSKERTGNHTANIGFLHKFMSDEQ